MTLKKAEFKHLQSTREKIQAAQLINRLQKHVEAKKPLLDSSQVAAAKALLNKVLPDLRAIEHSSDPDNPLLTKIELEVVDPKG